MACAFGYPWPWEGRAWERFELGPNFLAMKMEVGSAREAFPAGCGWHPWFRRGLGNTKDTKDAKELGEVRVTFPARRRYELDAGLPAGRMADVEGDFLLDGSPLGERRLDDCYTGLEGAVVVEWPRLRLTMTVECAFPHVQVYTPPEAFCIEPQTCAPDAFNLSDVSAGAGIATPGRPLAIASRWTWEALP
jgi:aldose 1-epimerase